VGESEEEMVDDRRPAEGRVVRDEPAKVDLGDQSELGDSKGAISVLTLREERKQARGTRSAPSPRVDFVAERAKRTRLTFVFNVCIPLALLLIGPGLSGIEFKSVELP